MLRRRQRRFGSRLLPLLLLVLLQGFIPPHTTETGLHVLFLQRKDNLRS